jgi:predicted 3-demethylubiquinone-9 3-methyltransferase (glyoxalase superfamily)
MQKITPFLWFDGKAEEAMRFYTSVFENSKPGKVTRAGETVTSVTFELEGQEFIALNGGPHFKFSPAVSFFVSCKTQQEVDYFWGRLAEGGETQPCGWLKDRYGLSWQTIPTALAEMLYDKDPQKSQRVMKAMLQMKRIDLEGLRQAHEGR